MLIFLVGGDRSPFFYIWQFRRWRLRFSPRHLPLVRRFRQERPVRPRLVDVRDFVDNLQLAMSLDESLTTALTRTTEQFANRGTFGQRLQRLVQSRVAIAPDDVITDLADNFQSDELKELKRQLALAKDWGIPTFDVLSASVEMLDGRISAQVEREIYRAPTILAVPMIVGVFLPALILSAMPLIVSVLTMIGELTP
jgi:hypothetical protein